MGIVLAAVSAIFYGSADFLGGLASRTATPLAVTWSSQVVGLVFVTIASLFVAAPNVTPGDLGLGAAAGLCGAVGLLLLYRALAVGPMSVVAPITAVCAALIPVAAGIIGGDRPGVTATIGLLAAFPAIVLVSRTDIDAAVGRDPVAVRVVVEATIAGAMFGFFMVIFAKVHRDAGLWPLVGARVSSIAMLSGVALATRASLAVPRSTWKLIAGTGAFDVTSNVLYLVATRLGLLSLVSVISAMYPASTVALARVVLREHIGRSQAVGLALVAAAVVLVAIGP